VKPPICAICHKRLAENEGGLVYFTRRESDIAWDEKREKTGMIGHPPWVAWFCDDHIGKAREFSGLTIDRAIAGIRADVKP
jgi:hypothetical protein